MVVILLLSAVIALLSRWVLISSLTSELKHRGLGIAQSVAEGSRGYIKDENVSALTKLLIDARSGHRKPLVAYLFILDQAQKVVAHTFNGPFHDSLLAANLIKKEQPHAISLIRFNNISVYDIAVPVMEGYYSIATVHVGLKKRHIDQLIGKLRNAFIGFISGITILFFWISHVISKQITRPISELVEVSDEISRGNLDMRSEIGPRVKCWEMLRCDRIECPAYENTEIPCWYIEGTLCESGVKGRFPEKLEMCRACDVHQRCAGDEVVQLAHSFTNMTLRLKYSKANLRASEAQYRTLFNSGPNPIFVLARKSLQILDVNPMALETYGYTREELLGTSFSELGAFDFEEKAEALGTPISKHTVTEKARHFKKGENPFFVKVKACPTLYRGEAAIILAATDITDAIEKDVQLMQASKMTTLGEMAAGVAHELSQPLNVIQMGSDYLKMMMDQKHPLSEKELRLISEQLSEQVNRASSIIENMREFGRKPDHKTQPIMINDPIRSVLKIFGKQLELQGIGIELDLSDKLPQILAQKNSLEQVFLNLISNARDAIIQGVSPDAGNVSPKIAIRTFQKKDAVVTRVSDTGVGISEDIQDRVFEPFFTTKEVGKGMGLGLSIIYGIVQDFNGTINLASTLGVGTTVTLSFPIAGKGVHDGE